MEISLPLLQSALQTLYGDPDPQNKYAAQKWLVKAQRDPSAWNWSFELLKDGNPTEGTVWNFDKVAINMNSSRDFQTEKVQYFGAIAIHYKITNCWVELPPDKIDDLRQEIFQLIFRFSNGPKMVLTRSCTALAALVIHRVTHSWPDAIQDIVQNFQNIDFPNVSMENKLIPEEYQTCRLDKTQKRDVRNGIKNGASCVLNLLLQLINSGQETIIEKAIKALGSWLALELPLVDVVQHLDLCFQTIQNPKYFEVSVDALMNALYSPSSHQYSNTIISFFPKIIQLNTLLDQAINNQDQESLLGLSKIICGLGENHCRIVLSKIDHGGMEIIKMILKVTQMPLQYPTEESCSPVSFSFWYSLQDEFESMTMELQQNWGPLIHHLFFELIKGLIAKLKLPDQKLLSSEEKESYRVYRIDISDTLMYIYNLLNQAMLEFMANAVCSIMAQEKFDWRDVEAILFCFYSIVESCEPDGDFIRKVAEVLPRLDMSNEYLADTVIYTVGSLAEWLVDNTQFISLLLPLVVPGLQKSELALTSVLTLKRITRECRFQFDPALSLQLAEVMRKSLHTDTMAAQEQLWLIQSIGHVLSAVDENTCLNELEKTVNRYINKIQSCSEQKTQITNHTKTALLHEINLLSNLQSTLDRAAPDEEGQIQVTNQRPACLIVQKMTPIFTQLLERTGPDTDILQAICHFFERSVRTMVEHGLEVMSPMSGLICQIIAQAPIGVSSAIDLAQQIISLYWREKPNECFMLLKAVTDTISHLKEAGGLNHNPDILTSSLELYGALMRRMSEFLIGSIGQESTMLFHMAEVACLGLHCPEQPVVKSSVQFITEFTRQTHPSILQMVEKFGQTFVLSLIQGITGNAGRTQLEYIGDGLFFISKPNVQNFAIWLNFWLAERRKIPDTKESDIQRTNFIQQLLRERSNKRHFREICSQFALMARGLHGVS